MAAGEHTGRRSGPRRALTASLALLTALAGALWGLWGLLTGPAAHAAQAARAAGTPTCTLGAYLSDLYDIDPAKHTFAARFRLWSVCPERDLDPLPKVSFSNVSSPEKGDPVVTVHPGGVRDVMLLQGTFRQNWDARAFPFDEQRIEVVVSAGRPLDEFRFVPDNANSAVSEGVAPSGWRVTGFRLVATEHRFPTNFGDPSLRPGSGVTHSQVRIRIGLERDDPTAFLKLTGPLYLMVLVVTATFLLPSHNEELAMGERLDSLQSRLGLLGGGLFVIMLNMQQVSAVVTSSVGLTLLDWLHLLTLAYVLLAVVGTVVPWRWTVQGVDPARVETYHHKGAVYGLLGYSLAAAAIVGGFAAADWVW
ncbi:hypothetical protein GO001_00090 [Streptomyces sp. NRRL B-1677]|uniref:hypothetical protein n=1 Tax=Streptomyces TaxID=1883 RepID=UPI0011C420C0|nr:MULTISPECIES: hypothetical protein [Streptomyces]MBF6043621.1 hypothetical protein [Streptomyces sp. NRRL B-1677]